jgi:hypothetical protein
MTGGGLEGHFYVAESISRLPKTSSELPRPTSSFRRPRSSTLVQSLTAAGLIDEYRFLVHPVILGSGKRYFKEGMAASGLKLIQSETLGLGVMLLCYRSQA